MPMSSKERTESIASSSHSPAWQALSTHLNQWYYKPDMEAWAVAMSAVAAHYLLATDPVWVFIVGASGTGKSVLVNALDGLENTHMVSDLSTKALLSGYKNKKKSSLLHRIGSGIILMKDFTTFMSKRDHDQKELASYLREIADGKLSREAGTGAIPVWTGKITIIAAATPALERAWATMRQLGERFVTVRWPRPNGIALARAARRQIGHEHEIAEKNLMLVRQIIQPSKLKVPPPLDPAEQNYLDHLAEAVACLRARVHRDNHGKREIVFVNEPEGTPRILKALELIARFHAQIVGNGTASTARAIARRLAFDSIPSKRLEVMMAIPPGRDEFAGATRGEIGKETGMKYNAVVWITDELEALGVIDREGDVEIVHQISESFSPIWLQVLLNSRS